MEYPDPTPPGYNSPRTTDSKKIDECTIDSTTLTTVSIGELIDSSKAEETLIPMTPEVAEQTFEETLMQVVQVEN
jgi:hypothetical protein